jgi:hypothetical protein
MDFLDEDSARKLSYLTLPWASAIGYRKKHLPLLGWGFILVSLYQLVSVCPPKAVTFSTMISWGWRPGFLDSKERWYHCP